MADLKLKYGQHRRVYRHFAPSALRRLCTFHLGRWPRLLHFAPLALRPGVFTRSLPAFYLSTFCLLPTAFYCLLPTAFCLLFYGFTMPWLPTGMIAVPYFILINLAGPSL